LLSEEGLGPAWSFAFDDSTVASGVIETEVASLDIGDLAGAFARFDPEPGPPPGLELDPLELQHFRAERRAGLHQLLDHLPCPVANRSSAGRSNGSKPLQMEMLRAAGFSVPAWIVSNERDRVLDFVERLDGAAIYKAVSGLRSHVRKLDDEVLQRLGEGTSPVLVQAYVEGVDVRVHVVDEECFGTEVTSLGVDYRFDGSLSYRVRDVPEDIARRCQEVARQEGLLLAGFDFRVDPEGEWFCLEVNPMPSFIPYEWATGQPIAEALLEVFEIGRQGRHQKATPITSQQEREP
jgi:glutathione synthase/RimK-type ligase-like ATP-grasp enzyme